MLVFSTCATWSMHVEALVEYCNTVHKLALIRLVFFKWRVHFVSLLVLFVDCFSR